MSWEEYYAQLALIGSEEIPATESAYNVAPTQQAPIIRKSEGSENLEIAFAMWGLVPSWWKRPLAEKKFSTFNAKSEDAADKSSFRSSWKNRPCLVPMSGYYEWQGPKGAKQPYAIALRNRRWFYVCGLWDRANIDGSSVDSFTILTTAANELTREIHHRMPVIPEQSEATKWITASQGDREAMIGSYDPNDMHLWKVGQDVGKVQNQGEGLIEPIE